MTSFPGKGLSLVRKGARERRGSRLWSKHQTIHEFCRIYLIFLSLWIQHLFFWVSFSRQKRQSNLKSVIERSYNLAEASKCTEGNGSNSPAVWLSSWGWVHVTFYRVFHVPRGVFLLSSTHPLCLPSFPPTVVRLLCYLQLANQLTSVSSMWRHPRL